MPDAATIDPQAAAATGGGEGAAATAVAGTNVNSGTNSGSAEPGKTTLGAMVANAAGANGNGQQTQAADPAAQTPEQKAEAEAKAKVEADAKAAEAAKNAVPEKYDFKVPENMKLDEEVLGEFTPFAKELKLNQENAQKAVDMGMKLVQKTQKAIAEQNQQAWDTAREKWLAEVKADKEVGGANYDQSKELAGRAIRWLNIPELQQVFDTGWGENPALFKAFVRIGKALGEDVAIDGAGSATEKGLEYKLYPTMREQK